MSRAIPIIRTAGQVCVGDLFTLRAAARPDALAIEHEGYRTSYGQLATRVARLAAALTALGVTGGERVAILSENRPEYIELILAAARIRAIVACQNWRLATAELAHTINLVEPRVIIVSPRYAAGLQQVSHGARRVIELGTEYETLIATAPKDTPSVPVDPEDGLLILYTSGTTGLPKGALISHRALIARMAAFRLDLGIADDDAFCAWAPMFHMASADHMLAALMSGAPVVVIDGFRPAEMVAAAAAHRLGWLVLMPGAIAPVIEEMQRNPVTPKGIRVIGAMADLVPIHQIAEITRLLGAPYLNSFGATETGLPPASRDLIAPGVAPSSLGKRQSSLCALRLVDPDDRDVAPGEPGEMAIRGPTVFSGYWNADADNRKDFRGGWFHMGDLFRQTADGAYHFVDRAKYMIKSGGENIYPAEIERVLLADARIEDAVVVRKRDARWGEIPVAFIAAREVALTVADVDALCRSQLAGYKRPKEVHFVALETLPRSTTGKVQRHEVEKWL
ncbi:MAG TPA: class I adenylate-forming enzyme family protein [Acetobacteraceae bacterium]